MLECVINVSCGEEGPALAAIAAAAGDHLLDRHTDRYHNRSVLTLAGPATEEAARAVARAVVRELDLRTHEGAHPRIGVLDVVPFVALAGSTPADARAARDRFGAWAGTELALPCFLYGPERSLPDVRRGAFTTLAPDFGPAHPHPTAGAAAVGVRGVLVAYNVWLAAPDPVRARAVAAAVRRPGLRALGLLVGDRVQVSMNLTDPDLVGPATAFDAVAALVPVAGAELVGLLPRSVLAAVDRGRWRELDLDDDRTIEARLERRTAAGGPGGARLEPPS